MVVRIRLARHGRKYRPFYRITVADNDPLSDSAGLKHLRLNLARVQYWLSVGAQPSPTLQRLFSYFNLLPTPPVRRDVPADLDVMRAMSGRGIRAEEKTEEEEGNIGRQVKAEWVYPVEQQQNGNANANAKKEKLKTIDNIVDYFGRGNRFLYRYKPVKEGQKSFPFRIGPTSTTFRAWEKARNQRISSAINPNRTLSPTPTPTPTPTPSSRKEEEGKEGNGKDRIAAPA